MEKNTRPPGKTTIAPEVLLSIARLNTLSVPGVSHLSVTPGDVEQLIKRGTSEGVKILVENGVVYLDIYVVMNRDVNVREVGRDIQAHVHRAISELVGMEVGKINIHVEDIDFSTSPKA